MFVTVSDKTVADYARNIQQDLLIPFLTVHDEYDALIDKKLFKPLVKKAVEIGSCKFLIDKVGLPYLNFLFDCEYDPWNTWSAYKSTDVYTIPQSKEEHYWFRVWKQEEGSTKTKPAETSKIEPKVDISEVVFQESILRDKLDDFLAALEQAQDDNTHIRVVMSDGSALIYSRKVDITPLQAFR